MVLPGRVAEQNPERRRRRRTKMADKEEEEEEESIVFLNNLHVGIYYSIYSNLNK